MGLPEEFEDLALLWQKGGISSRQAAAQLNISHHTFIRRAKEDCTALP